MGEPNDAWVAETFAEALDALAAKLWYGGNEELAARLRKAAEVLRVDLELVEG